MVSDTQGKQEDEHLAESRRWWKVKRNKKSTCGRRLCCLSASPTWLVSVDLNKQLYLTTWINWFSWPAGQRDGSFTSPACAVCLSGDAVD